MKFSNKAEKLFQVRFDMELYLRRILHGWSQVFYHGAKLTFLDFVYKVIVENLMTCYFVINHLLCILHGDMSLVLTDF